MLDSFSTVAGLSLLIDTLMGILPVVPGIVIWDQYVDLVEWSLNSLADFFSSGGLAIIAFTIIIKTILLPLTVKSIRSSKAMQDLQPKIKELQKKYGKDRQRLSQETMALYSAYGVNPMAGCLPMLLQIPIFFGLYVAIQGVSRSDAGFWHGGFLWLDSLNDADPYKILPILAGVFQFVQTRMMRPAGQGKITDPQQAVMNQMMNFMPLMVIIFGWSFASGPVLYWATQSVYSVVQQWFITGWGSLKDWLPWLPEMPEHRRLGYHPPRDLDDVVVVSGEAPPKKGVQGWLMKRMEEAQKQAAERQDGARQAGGQDGQGEPSGTRPNRARPSATAADDDAAEADTPTVTRRGTNAPSNRRSTSYQARVDAATKFSGRAAREPVNGDVGDENDAVVAGTNGRVNGQADGQADGRTTRRTARASTGNAGARTTSPQRRPSQPARPRKKRR